jgi:hypothetical protein
VKNHRSAERGATRVWKQLGWMGGWAAAACLTVFSVHVIYVYGKWRELEQTRAPVVLEVEE